MPTRRPRHQITETPEMAECLDRGAIAWPEIADNRTEVARRLIARGAQHVPVSPGMPSQHIGDHAGRWIAMDGDTIVAAHANARVLAEHLRRNDLHASRLYRVPVTVNEIASEHGQ